MSVEANLQDREDPLVTFQNRLIVLDRTICVIFPATTLVMTFLPFWMNSTSTDVPGGVFSMRYWSRSKLRTASSP